jgi:hypothetical protein
MAPFPYLNLILTARHTHIHFELWPLSCSTLPPLLLLEDIYVGPHPPSASFTWKTVTVMYIEMLEQFQHMTQLNLKSQNCTVCIGYEGLRTRKQGILTL